MNQTPRLTDRAALLRNRARAARAPAMFLQEDAAGEIKDRLELVNRSFTQPAVVTGFPQIWQTVFPDARIVADEDVLDLDEGAYDLVIHALALHWASDPVGQLIQARRALRPDGLCLVALFGGQTLHELRSALAEAEVKVTGGLSPRVLPMAEIRDLGGLLQRAGLALPVADSLSLNVSYADPFALMRDLRAMGEGNALDARLRRPTRKSVLQEAARIYTQQHADKTGRIRATFEMIFLSGWAPDASQPKPLRPGSAQARLADALGSVESKLQD
jgi:SAM-dependent methyltransferase